MRIAVRWVTGRVLATVLASALAACGASDDSERPYLGAWTTDEARVADDAEAYLRRRAEERDGAGAGAPDDLEAKIAQAREDAPRRREHVELRANGTATLRWQGGEGPGEDTLDGRWSDASGTITITPTNRDGRAVEPGEIAPVTLTWDGSRLAMQGKRGLLRSLRRYRAGESPPPVESK